MAERAPTTIGPAELVSSMRLMSWMPEYRTGGKPILLGGRELPAQIGDRLRGPIRILCVGPGDWLLLSHQHHAVIVQEHLGAELSRFGLVLTDLSDAIAGLAVRGPSARELLAKGCGLDLHPRSFPPERCARTRFAQIPVVVESHEEESRFELFASRSHLRYLEEWLVDAAVELR